MPECVTGTAFLQPPQGKAITSVCTVETWRDSGVFVGLEPGSSTLQADSLPSEPKSLVLICSSLINGVGCPFICLSAICIHFLGSQFTSFVQFSVGFLVLTWIYVRLFIFKMSN